MDIRQKGGPGLRIIGDCFNPWFNGFVDISKRKPVTREDFLSGFNPWFNGFVDISRAFLMDFLFSGIGFNPWFNGFVDISVSVAMSHFGTLFMFQSLV